MIDSVTYEAIDHRRYGHRIGFPLSVNPPDFRRYNSGFYFPFDPVRVTEMGSGHSEESTCQRKRIPVAVRCFLPPPNPSIYKS